MVWELISLPFQHEGNFCVFWASTNKYIYINIKLFTVNSHRLWLHLSWWATQVLKLCRPCRLFNELIVQQNPVSEGPVPELSPALAFCEWKRKGGKYGSTDRRHTKIWWNGRDNYTFSYLSFGRLYWKPVNICYHYVNHCWSGQFNHYKRTIRVWSYQAVNYSQYIIW